MIFMQDLQLLQRERCNDAVIASPSRCELKGVKAQRCTAINDRFLSTMRDFFLVPERPRLGK